MNFLEQTESLDALHLGITIANENRQITFVNQHFVELTGYSLDELMGQSLGLLVGPETDPEVLLRLKTSLAMGQAFQGELLNYRKDGSVFWNELNITPITNNKGEVIQYLGIQRDVTDNKHLEDQLKASEQSFYELANGSPIMISLSGLDKKTFWFNEKWKSYKGLETLSNSGLDWQEDIHPHDLFRVLNIYKNHFEQALPFRLGYRLKHCSGEYRWLDSQNVPRFDSQGMFNGYITYCMDNADVKKDSMANDFFNYSRELIYSTDANGVIWDVNQRFLEVTGYTRTELLGQHIRIIKSGMHELSFYKQMWHEINNAGFWSGEVINRKKNGSFYSVVSTITRVQSADGSFERYLAISSDISAIIEKRQHLEHYAYYDTLTGLPNRLLLNDRIKQAMATSIRHNAKMALLFVDFDGFKAINDQYGHDAGDAFLVAISLAMSNVLRKSDTLARLGGDEFVILLPELSQLSDINVLINKVLQACNISVPYNTENLQASASIGCALFNGEIDKDLAAQDLLHRADQAMYIAKDSGKNTYYIFDDLTDWQVNAKNERLAKMQAGLSRGEFVLYYQPKVNMRTGNLMGVEALIRWNHPIHGVLPPSEFLPLIENHHLNNDIGVWVINAALAQLQQWQNQGLNTAISINIHPKQLQQDRFIESLKNIIARYPDYVFGSLEIEILESGIIHNMKKVKKIMIECQAMGISFALDDFGTGYSSLSLLSELPAKTIKIDRSFINKAHENSQTILILESICYLANKLAYKLVAEGIETLEQGEMLLAMGCDLAQGYYIAKPMPSEQIPIWLETWSAPKEWLVRM